MKPIIIILIVVTTIGCNGQNSNQIEFTYENFENQVIAYEPKQKETVSKKDFDFGVMILNETKIAVKGNTNSFNRTNYWNILTAFLSLKESEKNILVAFEKFKQSDGSCEYFIAFENRVAQSSDFDILRDKYKISLKQCKENQIVQPEFNINSYITENQLNSELVQLVYKIQLDDQRYRNGDEKKFDLQQPSLDKKNQELIDSLFNKYNTYIGKSLVGEKFYTVMWSVIQHSNPEMMGRYLPVIQKAVKDKELEVVPLKMLIDRYYAIEYGYQVFGTQTGFDVGMADEKTRKEIEKKYEIE